MARVATSRLQSTVSRRPSNAKSNAHSAEAVGICRTIRTSMHVECSVCQHLVIRLLPERRSYLDNVSAAEEILKGDSQPCGACGGKTPKVRVSVDLGKGVDIHQKLANNLGISRALAKQMNFVNNWMMPQPINMPSSRQAGKSLSFGNSFSQMPRTRPPCEVCHGTGRRIRRRYCLARWRLGLEGSPIPCAPRTKRFAVFGKELFGEDDVDDQGRSCGRDLAGSIQNLYELRWERMVPTEAKNSHSRRRDVHPTTWHDAAIRLHPRSERIQSPTLPELQRCRKVAEGKLSVGVRYSWLDLPLSEFETEVVEYCARNHGLVFADYARPR